MTKISASRIIITLHIKLKIGNRHSLQQRCSSRYRWGSVFRK